MQDAMPAGSHTLTFVAALIKRKGANYRRYGEFQADRRVGASIGFEIAVVVRMRNKALDERGFYENTE
jgi:hypothetical protein